MPVLIDQAGSRVPLPYEELAVFCQKWGISKLEIFGSILRDDFRQESDIDFLFTASPRFLRDLAYGPWGKDNMAAELEQLLGRKVELIERKDIENHRNWVRRQHILDTAQPVYVEG